MNDLTGKRLTMTSTEIAQLTGKNKADIHRDIKTQLLVGRYGFTTGKMVEISTINRINGLERWLKFQPSMKFKGLRYHLTDLNKINNLN